MKPKLLIPLALMASFLFSLNTASAAKPETVFSSQPSAQTFGGARIIISSGYHSNRDCGGGSRYRDSHYRGHRGGYYYQRPRRDYYYREYRPRPRRDDYYNGGYRYRGCR